MNKAMAVPVNITATSRLRHLFSLLVLFLFVPPLLARNPDPSLSIPIEPLGFQPLSTQFLLAGSSMFTLHYVDDQHLLVTFGTRRLLKRIPDCPPDDQDRWVDAVLLELPSGRILGRTEWRLHDHGQYLWSLGHGRFLLRIRDTLTTFAPLANLSTGRPFRERPFITTDRRIGGVLLSPDADLLIVESIERPTEPSTVLPAAQQTQPIRKPANQAPVQIDLFRLSISPGSRDEVGAQLAGSTRSRIPGRIPANSAGYLAIIDQGKQSWAFDFNSFTGKTTELSPFDSSCRPSPIFVSRSEFIAFACHGGPAYQVIGAFNLKGEQMWEQTFTESYTAPSFDYAPQSGRFALSRIIARMPVGATDPLISEMISSQSVTVYQTDSGKQIMRIDSQPVQRAGQNFALSPDGMSLATVHGDAIEIYRLPPLTPQDRTAVKEAQAMAPAANDAPIRLSAPAPSASPATESAFEPPVPDSTSPAQSPTQSPDQPSAQPGSTNAIETPPPSPAQDTTTDQSATTKTPPSTATTPSPTDTSDQQPKPEERRKPPTLYNLPTDTPPDKPASPPK